MGFAAEETVPLNPTEQGFRLFKFQAVVGEVLSGFQRAVEGRVPADGEWHLFTADIANPEAFGKGVALDGVNDFKDEGKRIGFSGFGSVGDAEDQGILRLFCQLKF